MVTPDIFSLKIESVTKRFSSSPVFSPVTFDTCSGNILAITGANGSGKSTLLKIIAGVTAPTKGTSDWLKSEKECELRDLQKTLGFVSPYLELYNELTAAEHVQFVAELKENKITKAEAISTLVSFGLDMSIALSDRTLKQYSSGMQQRVRLAMAFIGDPKILLLDEPSSNLDEEGKQTLFRKIEAAAAKGVVVIIATNDEREKRLASREIALYSYENKYLGKL